MDIHLSNKHKHTHTHVSETLITQNVAKDTEHRNSCSLQVGFHTATTIRKMAWQFSLNET